MTKIFNRSFEKTKRLQLRRNMPEPEIILWSCLQRNCIGGHKFRRQYGIGRYVVDFYCPKMKLAIEVDGESHLGRDSQEYDQVREEFISSLGIKTIRFNNSEIVTDLNRVLDTITLALHPFVRHQSIGVQLPLVRGGKGAYFPSLPRRGTGRLKAGERVA